MSNDQERLDRPTWQSYSAPDTPPPPRPDPPHWTLWWVYLVFRPRQFFEVFVLEASPVLTALTAWFYGVVTVMDRIEVRSLTSPDNPILVVQRDWGLYWGFCAAMGILSGALYYGIGGWWYRVRLKWSGAASPDAGLARRVYIYAAQAFVMPSLLYTLLETVIYATPLAAAAGDDLYGMIVVVALFWSVYVSYRGVRTAFEVNKWPARIWFFILPGVIYGVFVVGILVVGLLAGFLLEPRPDVDRPAVLEREHYSLRYPGNWLVDTTDPDHDPDWSIGIEPAFADAVIQIWFYGETQDSRGCVDETLGGLEEAHDMGDMQSIGRWGRYAGAGYRGDGTIEGKAFAITIFCSSDESPPFEIMQIVETGAVDRTEVGFDLIRESFEVRRE